MIQRPHGAAQFWDSIGQLGNRSHISQWIFMMTPVGTLYGLISDPPKGRAETGTDGCDS